MKGVLARAVAGAALVLVTAAIGQAQGTFYRYDFPGLHQSLPDGGGVGGFSQFSTTGLPGMITEVTVYLDISGTWSGDLYAYLNLVNLEGAHAVLLNCAGRTSLDPIGYGDCGFQVTLQDSAPNGDIHVYRDTFAGAPPLSTSGALIGTWAPDGRTTDPDKVTSSDARTAMLGTFVDKNPNGQWTLFVADMAPGSRHRLEGWGLGIRVDQVPEPSVLQLLVVAGALLWVVRRNGSLGQLCAGRQPRGDGGRPGQDRGTIRATDAGRTGE